MRASTPFAAAAATFLAMTVPATTAIGAPYDLKGVSASICQPYAPDTTSAQIQVTQSGVYNPGTTIEKVICPLPRDTEQAYAAEALVVGVYYRVLGGAPGRVTCTVFIGSTGMHSAAVLTATGSGALVSGGTRGVLWLYNAALQDLGNTVVPNQMICAISPKTQLAAIYVEEQGKTDVDA